MSPGRVFSTAEAAARWHVSACAVCRVRALAGFLAPDHFFTITRQPKLWASWIAGGERRVDIVELLAICRAAGADPHEIIRKMK